MEEFEHYHLEDNLTHEEDWVSSPNVVRTDKNLSVKEFFVVNDTESISKRGHKINLTSIPTRTSAYSVLLTDFLIEVGSVSVAPTITLPKASLAGFGKIYIVKDASGSAAATTITVAPTGADLINGDTNIVITTNYGFLGFFCDGANWFTA